MPVLQDLTYNIGPRVPPTKNTQTEPAVESKGH